MLNFSMSGNLGKISSSFSWWWLVPCHAMSTTSSGSDISSRKSDGPSSVINLKNAPWSLLYEIANARPSGLQQIPVIFAFGKFSNLSNFQTRSNFSNRWRNSSPSSDAQHTVSLFVLIAIFIIFTPYVCSTANLFQGLQLLKVISFGRELQWLHRRKPVRLSKFDPHIPRSDRICPNRS